MITTAVLGASGYAGGELIRFLDAHPSFELVYLGANTSAGRHLSEVHPQLTGGDRMLGGSDVDAVPPVDLVFLALPHGASAAPAMALAGRGAHIVDLGSDFRLDTAARYVEAYREDHPYPDQLGAWAYGIPELFRSAVGSAKLTAAPGCYPTSALIGLGPVAKAGLVRTDDVVIDAMSGVSGAGRAVSEGLQFGAVDESVRAYKVLEHRHQPEIERALDALTGGTSTVLFTPHLVPMQRGILSTIHTTLMPGVEPGDVIGAIDEAYESSPFVRRIEALPETRWVVGSNNALVSVRVDRRTGRIVLFSAIDNLVKGAAGQAIQCANLMFGMDESAGLPMTGWMP